MDRRLNRGVSLLLSAIIIYYIQPKLPVPNESIEPNSNAEIWSEIEPLEEEEMWDEETINIILDDWKLYQEALYQPKVGDEITANDYSGTKNKDNSKFINSVKNALQGYKTHPDYFKILERLNSRGVEGAAYREGLNVTYGVTQINVKLIPLAQLYYSDFESNVQSQLLFLNKYIELKSSKGYSMVEVIEQYKYCKYK